MPAVLVDVGHHLVEPDTRGQSVVLTVESTDASDAAVVSFDLRAQIVTAKQGPYFQGVRFAGDLWNSFPHVESGSPLPTNRSLATGEVAFTRGFEAQADGTLVTLTIDTTGIAAGSYEFRLVGTLLGSSSFRRADGTEVSEVITNGTLQVRSIWQNPDNPNDVDGDGRVSPRDVLLLLNELSKRGARELELPSPTERPTPHYDVNGDGFISPLDPLGAINCLNGLSCVTTPQPILAQVTPDFAPAAPGSAGVGAPVPDTSNPEEPIDCVYYDLDENGNPFPVIDPDFCIDPHEAETNPLPIASTAPSVIPQAGSTIAAPLNGSVAALSATPAVPVLSSESVDAAMRELVDELAREETSEELVELGLSGIFARS